MYFAACTALYNKPDGCVQPRDGPDAGLRGHGADPARRCARHRAPRPGGTRRHPLGLHGAPAARTAQDHRSGGLLY